LQFTQNVCAGLDNLFDGCQKKDLKFYPVSNSTLRI